MVAYVSGCHESSLVLMINDVLILFTIPLHYQYILHNLFPYL